MAKAFVRIARRLFWKNLILHWGLGQLEESNGRDSRSDDPSSDDEPKASCLVSVSIRIAVPVKPVLGEVKPISMV